MTTLLVANRGEIARRIFRTAARMGMHTVAVYSDADAEMPFVREADAAVRIGPAPARDSYLAIDRIIAAARETKADLVHPGYGFLAEEPRFASAVDAAGITFVGPPPSVLAALGDKAEAKALAERAKVPVLPGYRGADQSDDAFLRAARAVGYPVMIKPVSGGGGIGMQAVRAEDSLRDALARARRLATSAFGDERLLIERLVERPRHVEVQILADDHGNVLSVGERDCSAQRRHQKIVEESPAPSLSDATRRSMANAAVALARTAGYRSAGTVEFIVDDRGNFFFLEVNARLQVEHPVTELVWGVDLVEQQLRIAQGGPTSLDGRTPKGHAFEARLYAEDPAAGFVPSTGTIAYLRWADGVRVDSAIEEGSSVSTHYDPLLAKIIAFGDDRETARARLVDALRRSDVLGVRTNKSFLIALLERPAVREGHVDTDLVERELASLVPEREAPPPEVYAAAAAARTAELYDGARSDEPWAAARGWRLGAAPEATIVLDDRAVRVRGVGPFEVGTQLIRADGEAQRWRIGDGSALAVRDRQTMWTVWRGETYELSLAERERSVAAAAGAEVSAPMPGMVIDVAATPGRRVRRGDLLFVVEAMKMELRVEAPADGAVKAVLARVGQQVDRGERLAEFEADPT